MLGFSSQASIAYSTASKKTIAEDEKENSAVYNIVSKDNPLTVTINCTELKKPNSYKFLDIIDFNTNLFIYSPIDPSSISVTQGILENDFSQFIRIYSQDLSAQVFNPTLPKTLCETAHLARCSQQCIICEDTLYIYSVLGYKTPNTITENVCIGDLPVNTLTFEMKDDNDNLLVFKKPFNFKFKVYDHSNF